MSINSNYFPSDFIHGILAAHCGSQTVIVDSNSIVKDGDSVKFSLENELYKIFKDKNIDLNEQVSKWRVYKVVEFDEETGYLGIIYENIEAKQIVLSHRSTNFALDFTIKNIFKPTGVSTDVDNIMMGRIVAHQAHGYVATKTAVEYVKEKESFALSITGHSLGAWLADLSVFYCNRDLDYKYVKAVTFDGPGSYEMMVELSKSEVKNAGEFDKRELYIISYLSAPNIVNCANQHVGQVYRLFPDIQSENDILRYLGEKKHDAIIATLGHSMKYFLPQFNASTGRPERYEEIITWPSIKYTGYGHPSESFLSKTVGKVIGKIPGVGKYTAGVIKGIANKIISKFLGQETTTLGSIFNLLDAYFNGKMDEKQFWEAHKYLDKFDGFDVKTTDDIQSFNLLYKGQYNTVPTNEDQLKYLKGLDSYFKIKQRVSAIEQSSNENFRKDAIKLIRKYDYKEKGIVVNKKYTDNITITELRDELRKLLNHYKHDIEIVKNTDKVKLSTDVPKIFTKSSKLHLEGESKPLQGFCRDQLVRLIDFNGDGKLDLACSKDNGNHSVLLSTGTALKSPNQYLFGDLYIEGQTGKQNSSLTDWCEESVKWVDFNGDRRMDLACNSADGKHRVLLSTGKALKSPNQDPQGALKIEGHEHSLKNWCAAANRELAWIDFNGDGKMDLICSNTKAGEHRVLLSTGSALESPNQYPFGTLYIEGQNQILGTWCIKEEFCDAKAKDANKICNNSIVGELSLADFNGDGKTDLICSNTRDGQHYVLLSTGSALISPTLDQGLKETVTCISQNMKWIDFNGDKAVDFSCLVGGGEYNVMLSTAESTSGKRDLQSPNPSFEGKLIVPYGYVDQIIKSCTPQNAEWVDINIDGKADLVCYTEKGYYILLSTGTEFLFKSIEFPENPSDNMCIHKKDSILTWGKFNNDDLIDLICSTSEGEHTVLLGWNEYLIPNPEFS